MATSIVMHCESWLHLLGFPREVQLTVKDLPFEGPKLFSAKIDESLHTLRDSMATLKLLGICIPANKKKKAGITQRDSAHLTHSHTDNMTSIINRDKPDDNEHQTSFWCLNYLPQDSNFESVVKSMRFPQILTLEIHVISRPFGDQLSPFYWVWQNITAESWVWWLRAVRRKPQFRYFLFILRERNKHRKI